MATYTNKTNPKDLELYKYRAKNVDLIWCKQVVQIMLDDSKKNGLRTVNDIGCNYGQLYKEIKRRNLTHRFDYHGFDIDEIFLNLAVKTFPEIQKNVSAFNIENSKPRIADITVCSAVFEHLDNPNDALTNMLESTAETIILRTFVGDSDIRFIHDSEEFVSSPYNINQFNLFWISHFFFDSGFSMLCVPDNATGMSKTYEVADGSSVFRKMYILVGKRFSSEAS